MKDTKMRQKDVEEREEGAESICPPFILDLDAVPTSYRMIQVCRCMHLSPVSFVAGVASSEGVFTADGICVTKGLLLVSPIEGMYAATYRTLRCLSQVIMLPCWLGRFG